MINKIAWNVFKQTGNINTMMEIIKVDEAINNNKKFTNEDKVKIQSKIENKTKQLD